MDSANPAPIPAPPAVGELLDFAGKVALVTGASSGIGRGIAARFAEAGARVMAHYHSNAASAQMVVERFGRLDVLVNNAGIYPLATLLEMTPAQWDEVIDANLRSMFLCTQAAARQMIAQGQRAGTGQGSDAGGVIVNITSIEAENPAPSHSHYNAAKGGALMFTRAAAAELGPHGIRVNAVAPGLMWREDIEQIWPDGVARFRAAAPLGRLGMPEDVADACLFLASPAARWITGASLTVDGGVMAHQIF